MTKLPKFFLTVSVTAFAVAFASVSSNNIAPAWSVAIPIGAIFLGLFLIAFMLQNEVAQFDEETRLRLELMNDTPPPYHSAHATEMPFTNCSTRA